MKNSILTFLLILIIINLGYGQDLTKPLIDTGDLKNFEIFNYSYYKISDNANYIYYDQARPVALYSGSTKLATVKSIKGNWETEVNLDGVGDFTPDSKYLVYKTYRDKRLAILELGSKNADTIDDEEDDQIIRGNKNAAMICYIEKKK